MKSLAIIVRVPTSDATELQVLQEQLPGLVKLGESRAFDGIIAVQALVTVTLASLPVLRSWLVKRAEHRKSTTVLWKGTQLTGYTAAEVIAIVEAVERAFRKSGEESAVAQESPEAIE